jgi:Tfp pilus assembly protein PilX
VASRPQERGVALLVGLIVLLIISLLATHGMQSSILQEKMAANARNRAAAFEAAEGAARAAEALVRRGDNVTGLNPINEIVCEGAGPGQAELFDNATGGSFADPGQGLYDVSEYGPAPPEGPFDLDPTLEGYPDARLFDNATSFTYYNDPAQREPELIIEWQGQSVQRFFNEATLTTQEIPVETFRITVRAFGPGTPPGQPNGSEVILQAAVLAPPCTGL